ncbi:hypothetical protein NDU88_004091 [Pleurodeles waltl]|uniref:Uncharacterized protein n=1 Tax=Pleurodeles waltl TaxID=8319 RepID=A0AAV7NLR1_PLEWA|nr:hypothetical protein NDU88_004091 [Pleurodeles waltl]
MTLLAELSCGYCVPGLPTTSVAYWGATWATDWLHLQCTEALRGHAGHGCTRTSHLGLGPRLGARGRSEHSLWPRLGHPPCGAEVAGRWARLAVVLHRCGAAPRRRPTGSKDAFGDWALPPLSRGGSTTVALAGAEKLRGASPRPAARYERRGWSPWHTA